MACTSGFAIVFLLGATVGLAENSPKNLASNPGFEEWPAKPEKENVWAATGYSVDVKGRDGTADGRAYRTGDGELDSERHSGRYAQYMQTTTWGRGAVAGGIPVTAGHRYHVSVWTKLLSGKFQVGVCNSQSSKRLGEWIYGEPNAQWTRYEKEVVVPNECKRISTLLYLQSGNGYLDDFEVVDLGEAATASAEADTLPLFKGRLVPRITRRRVAIFDEPAFPSESPRSADWYEATLQGAGLQVTRLGWRALCDPAGFSRERFDTLILPTGGNFPADAEKAIELFLARGGTLLVDESLVMRTAPVPKEGVWRKLAQLEKDYLAGKGAYAYFDLLSRHHWTAQGKMFSFDEKENAWNSTPMRTQSYQTPQQASHPEGLGFRTWPNYAAPFYARAFSEELRRNPELESVLSGFPATIPPDEKPSRARGALRLALVGGSKVNVIVHPEYACDLLLPLYEFATVSNANYPALPDAGKDERDREADFYVLRYHNSQKEGGTLLHFGCAGAKLLRGDQAGQVLIESLRLAESALPGECPPEFVQAANRVHDLFSAYSMQSLSYRDTVLKLVRLATYAGRKDEAARLVKEFGDEKRRFETLGDRSDELDRLLIKREGGLAYGHQGRLALIRDLEAETARLKVAVPPVAAKWKAAAHPPARVAVENPFGGIYFGLDNTLDRGALELEDFRHRIEAMGLAFQGLGLTSYTEDYVFKPSPFKREFDTGVLDPRTGVVKPAKFRWMETPEDLKNWRESFRWQLECVQHSPEVNCVFAMEERNLEWSLWGPRDRALFLDYLRAKYGTVEKLNAVWNTAHPRFDDIVLPVAQPKAQPEHACWEDWTRYREVYRLERELKPITELLVRYAPRMVHHYWPYASYYRHENCPANGINFYEYGKQMAATGKVNGFEHSNEERIEWLVFDICGMFVPSCAAEWGAFYFPPPGYQAKVDLLTECLWRGVANGQAGWSLFNFSMPGWPGHMDLVNRPYPSGWELAGIYREFGLLEHIILDGKREEAPIRVVYSPTTRRHTSWPGVEGDISYSAVAGLYTAFKNAHIQARAIDEQAVWEGHLPSGCRLLILPEVLYENPALHDKAIAYLRGGGGILVTPGSGRFDEYGRRRDSWLTLAGVAPQKAGNKVITVGEGMRYFSAAYSDDIVALKPVFADETRVLARFQDGKPALTETRVGKGKLFVLGVNIGQDCNAQYQGNPEIVVALLKPALDAMGVTREITLSPQNIMVRPWRYQGQRYLFLTSTGRKGIEEYALSVRGAWKFRDYLLGAPLPVKYQGGESRVSGMIDSPGGRILALTPSTDASAAAGPAPAVSASAEAPPVPVSASTAVAKISRLDETTPFAGRLWARDGATRMGAFTFEIDVETGGGWGGKTFLSVGYGGEKWRKLCEPNKEIVFYFTDRVLRVTCDEVVAVYPVNLKCRIAVEKPAPVVSACRLAREPYFGRESLVLSNGLLRVRLLPTAGGRMIEFASLPDGTNHAYTADTPLAAKGGGNWQVDHLDGMEETASGLPGPYWNADFEPTVLGETPDCVAVRLAMKAPVEWSASYSTLPQGGYNRLVKDFILKRGESALTVRMQEFNCAKKTMPTGLRTHPIWAIGGDGDPGDRWIFRSGGRLVTRSFPFAPGTTSAEGDWTALVDVPKRIAVLDGFAAGTVETLGMYGLANCYDLELWAPVRDIAPGRSLDLEHTLVLIRGLSGVTEYTDGMAVEITCRQSDAPVMDEPWAFDVAIGGIRVLDGTAAVSVSRDGKTVEAFPSAAVLADAGKAATVGFVWQSRGQKDGVYEVVVRFEEKGTGKFVEARRSVERSAAAQAKRLQGLAAYEVRIEAIKEEYRRAKDAGRADSLLEPMRERITRAALQLSQLESLVGANRTEEARRVEKALQDLLASP